MSRFQRLRADRVRAPSRLEVLEAAIASEKARLAAAQGEAVPTGETPPTPRKQRRKRKRRARKA